MLSSIIFFPMMSAYCCLKLFILLKRIIYFNLADEFVGKKYLNISI